MHAERMAWHACKKQQVVQGVVMWMRLSEEFMAGSAPVQLVHGHEGVNVVGVLPQQTRYVVGVKGRLTLLKQRLHPLHTRAPANTNIKHSS